MNLERLPFGKQAIAPLKRKAVVLSEDQLVKIEHSGANELPVVFRAQVEGINAAEWIKARREAIRNCLKIHGGILFRGFDVKGCEGFGEFVKSCSPELLEYKERSSPRTQIGGNIYTSTDYPSDQSIFLHNENSYQKQFPLRIYFFGETPALEGGETPIADVRRVYAEIDESVRDAFAKKGVMYVRNFDGRVGLSWQSVFQTEDRASVEKYCQEAGISCEWLGGGRLRTRQVRPAVATHPETGDAVWFNHATFFHVTTLPAQVREALLRDYAYEDLPNNTFYGDGRSIEPPVMDALRTAYEKHTVRFPWQKNDILMLDNMLVAHGRAPFKGPRKVLVGMAEPHSLSGL